jgi:hypothetical protein
MKNVSNVKYVTETVDNGIKYIWNVSYYEALRFFYRSELSFISQVINTFISFPSETYYWECIPITFNNVKKIKFEYVITKASIPLEHSPEKFKQHLRNCVTDNQIMDIVTPKGTDLVATCPLKINYSSIGPYLSSVYKLNQQLKELFHRIGKKMLETLRHYRLKNPNQRIFLRTHGLDVPLLHIRIQHKDVPSHLSHSSYLK